MRTIAITGATGFVGRQILSALFRSDCSLRLIVRKGSRLPSYLEKLPAEFVETSDLFSESLERLRELLKNVDTLIHAAWYAEPGLYLTSLVNIDCLIGTLRLAQAFTDCNGRRFIGLGTCFEYDLSQGRLHPDSSMKPQSLYAACKASAYQVLKELFSLAHKEFTWCRLFYLYGEGEDERRLVPYLRRRLSAGEPAELTSGKQIRDFMDVREAGRMIAEEALGERQGVINICSGVPISVKELAEKIADEYGRRDLLRFGIRSENQVDPPCVVGVRETFR